MYEQIVKLRLLADVLISDHGAYANTVDSLSYIPGSTLRGALASKYLHNNNLDTSSAHKDAGFYRLFLSQQLRYENAYQVQYDGHKPVYLRPFPYCFQVKKSYEDEFVNAFVPEAAFEPENKIKRGYYDHKNIYKIYFSSGPQRERNFHMSRNGADGTRTDLRLHGTSDGGTIFHYEALQKGQDFHASIRGDIELLQELFDGVMGQGNTLQLRLGRSRQVQYGGVELSRGELREIEHSDWDKDGELLIELDSPAIILNGFGFPEVSPQIMGEYWQEITECQVTISSSIFRPERSEGFVRVWQNHRPSQLAFAAGSCFKLSIPPSEEEKFKQKMPYIMERGIGERCNEGYGRISIIPELNRNFKSQGLAIHPNQELADFKVISATVVRLFNEVIYQDCRSKFLHKARIDASQYWNHIVACRQEDQLNAHMIGRLERWLEYTRSESSLTWRDFSRPFSDDPKNLDGSRETRITLGLFKESFIDKLKALVGGDLQNSLDQFEKDYLIIMENYKPIQTKLNQADEVDNQSAAWKEELYYLYWQTFFRQIRQLVKVKNRREVGKTI